MYNTNNSIYTNQIIHVKLHFFHKRSNLSILYTLKTVANNSNNIQINILFLLQLSILAKAELYRYLI